jgi:hypothetical protein
MTFRAPTDLDVTADVFNFVALLGQGIQKGVLAGVRQSFVSTVVSERHHWRTDNGDHDSDDCEQII